MLPRSRNMLFFLQKIKEPDNRIDGNGSADHYYYNNQQYNGRSEHLKLYRQTGENKTHQQKNYGIYDKSEEAPKFFHILLNSRRDFVSAVIAYYKSGKSGGDNRRELYGISKHEDFIGNEFCHNKSQMGHHHSESYLTFIMT